MMLLGMNSTRWASACRSLEIRSGFWGPYKWPKRNGSFNFHRRSLLVSGRVQDGPLLVVNGVITPINGLING